MSTNLVLLFMLLAYVLGWASAMLGWWMGQRHGA